MLSLQQASADAATVVFEMQGAESGLARKAHAASSAAAAAKKDVRASGLAGESAAGFLVPTRGGGGVGGADMRKKKPDFTRGASRIFFNFTCVDTGQMLRYQYVEWLPTDNTCMLLAAVRRGSFWFNRFHGL